MMLLRRRKGERLPDEVHPNGTREGWGCPAISNRNMKAIDALLREQRKPVLV